MRKAAAVEMGRSSAGGVMASVSSRSISSTTYGFGERRHQKRALPELLSGRKGAHWVSPNRAADRCRKYETVAHRDGDEWVLNGQKMFITVAQASYFVIGARTGGEVWVHFAVFCRCRCARFFPNADERKMGWWASDTATLF